MKVEAPYDIESYLEGIQQLSPLNDHQRILEYIEEYKSEQDLPQNLQSLFTAEEAFYKHRYKTALQYYLQAKNTPHYEFFCFRASAYASEEINNYLKAIQFAKKALRIRPDDHPSLKLLARTYTSIDQRDKAQIIHKKLKDLYQTKEKNEKKPTPEHEDSHHFIPVGEQELEELSQIFSTREPDQTGLFAREASTIKKHTYENDTSPDTETNWKKEGVVFPPGCDLFSHSPKRRESEESLTKRLYEKNEAPQQSFVETPPPLITNYQQIKDYHNLYRRNTSHRTNFLFSCDPPNNTTIPYPIQNLISPPRKSFMVHWEGHGIAINPGKDFLETLHHHTFFLQDIQAVIITDPTPDSYEELYSLYTLSSKLSELNLTPPLTFYVHPKLYEQLKLQWPSHRQIYTLMDTWKIQEKIQCHTHRSDSEVCGVSLDCKNNQHQLRITYLTRKLKNIDPCDLLIMNTSNTSTEDIPTPPPKMTVLYDTTGATAHEKLRCINNLQAHIPSSHKIIPCTEYLHIQLNDLSVLTEEEQKNRDASELCAVPASRSTIKLVPKESIVEL